MRLAELKIIYQGKVRNIYEVDSSHLILEATNRVSAFDVVLDNEIPNKGILLTKLSDFWFKKFINLSNHLATQKSLSDILDADDITENLVLVKKLTPLPVEAIVRGYLIGGGWAEYQKYGSICDVKLPKGLKQASKLPEAIFTPSTKARVGDKDININFKTLIDLIGVDLAGKVKNISLEVYQKAAEYSYSKGIILADTKLEFGLDEAGELYIIDELLTSDSSRYWDLELYEEGISPPSYDKQIVRDYLDANWLERNLAPPQLPSDLIQMVANKYNDLYNRLSG